MLDPNLKLLSSLSSLSKILSSFKANTLSFSPMYICFVLNCNFSKFTLKGLFFKTSEMELFFSGYSARSFLLIDNYKSDYTLSIFLKKLLAEYPEKNNSISEVLKNNPYRVNFEQLQFNTKQVYISEKLRVLALKEESIFESELNEDNNLRLGSSIIFNYLIGN